MASLDESSRRLVIDGERAARAARNPRQQRAALLPQYQLYLNVLTRGTRPLAERADEYLRVVRAMRDEQEFADLGDPDGADDPAVERFAARPLRVLAAYLQRLPGAVVLIIESGASLLTLFTMRGGAGAIEDRVTLGRASAECVAALTALMRQQLDDIERIRRREPVSRALYEPIEMKARTMWSTLPPAVRDSIAGARTVLFLPGSFGDLSTFPLELVCTDAGWLGTTHAVARLHSLRTLFELLSPGRMPSQLDASALVVRARDSDELTAADEEVRLVSAEMRALGLGSDGDPEPRVASMRAALDRGLRVLHFCGHGFAGELGEALPLAANEVLEPTDLSMLSGWGTPFVYLSTCEIGRARMGATGSAIGMAARLIEKGAPALVGCLASVPDLVARSIAVEFYRAAATAPVGEALTTARRASLKFPPACWGAFACFGDPGLTLAGGAGDAAQTRRATVRWDTRVGRYAALASEEARAAALDAIEQAAGGSDLLAARLPAVGNWLRSAFQPCEPGLKEARLALCAEVGRADAVAGCELRVLLAMESLRGGYFGERKPEIVVQPEELQAGLVCAKAVHDTLAWAALAIEGAGGSGILYAPAAQVRMLDEAIGMLEGWRLEEAAAAGLVARGNALRSAVLDDVRSGDR